jgi:hypothetical protein
MGRDHLYEEPRTAAARRRVPEVRDEATEPQPSEAALVGRALFGAPIEAWASQKNQRPNRKRKEPANFPVFQQTAKTLFGRMSGPQTGATFA